MAAAEERSLGNHFYDGEVHFTLGDIRLSGRGGPSKGQNDRGSWSALAVIEEVHVHGGQTIFPQINVLVLAVSGRAMGLSPSICIHRVRNPVKYVKALRRPRE